MNTRSWVTLVGVSLSLGLVHCSNSAGTFDGTGGAQPCDDSKCNPGNQCIESNGVTECRLTCDAQRGATGCPTNYSCVIENAVGFCKADKFQPTPGPGQWGAPCSSLEGALASECDQANEFYCQYDDRNDPNAFCTSYCNDDADCTGGYYCGTANDIPGGVRDKRTIGAVHKVCLPRDYCAPCVNDLDCAVSNDGTKQVCVADANNQGICTKPCSKNTNCNDEAACVDVGLESNVCYPIAGVCVGDGNLCSPCRSDSDCTAGGGACVQSRYSTERSCTVASKKPCNVTGDTPVYDCPDLPEGTARGSFVSCVGQVFAEVPEDQCSGLVPLGGANDGQQVGCYARRR